LTAIAFEPIRQSHQRCQTLQQPGFRVRPMCDRVVLRRSTETWPIIGWS